MRKGISPIVAVVLLIAIAVIAAVGLYFWVGGLATKQPTQDAPISIAAQSINCSGGNPNGTVTVMIQNLDATSTLSNTLNFAGNDGAPMTNLDAVNIAASSQGLVEFFSNLSIDLTEGTEYTIYSNASGVGTAIFVC